MTIKWNLPANFFSNQTFVYNSTLQNSSNLFAGSLFNNTTTYSLPQLPLLFPPSLPLFNFGKANFNNVNFSKSNGLKISTETQNQSLWNKLGYSAQKGYQLAKNATSNAIGFTGYCARYVKSAISNTGLGKYESGNACDLLYTMRKNKNFKEISPEGVNLKTLPAGCVLVYDKGVAGYSSKYGHTEITTGTGKAVSDGVTNNLYKKPTAIFMPINA